MYINVGSSGDALNLSNLLKNGDWMVLYYAEWCGHCQTMKPEWNKVVKKLKKNNNNVNIAEIESNHIDKLVNKPNIQGFPTIKMYNNGKEVANFEDERVANKMEKFAIHNSKKSKHIKHNVFKQLNNKTNTNNNINLLPNNNINLLPKENINNSINKLNNNKPSVINNKTKECRKYVIPKQCKSVPDCTFDYKIKKCIVKKPKTIKKIIEEKPMITQNMMNEPMMNEPMMNEPMMNEQSKKTVRRKKTTPRTIKSKTVRRKKSIPRTIKSKTLRRKKTKRKTNNSKITQNKKKKNYDLKKSTKSIFSKLINSFDRIGDEAKKDAELLTEARHLL